MFAAVRSPLVAVVLAAALPAAGGDEPPAPPAPEPASFLSPARRERVECGPQATQAAAVLEAVGRTGHLDLAELDRLRELATGGEALRHPDLTTLALAVAFEQDLPIDEVSPARRRALLRALMAPVLPESACLPPKAVRQLRGRLLYAACRDLEAHRVEVEQWAQCPARLYLLLIDRSGPPPIPDECRHPLRRELGDPAEIELLPPRPAEREGDDPPA
jgi:hypothetical protein